MTTVVLDGPSGTEFAAAFEEKLGYPPNTRDTMLYDGAMTMMLASIVAVQTNNLDDPTLLTGAQLRDAMSHVQDPAGMKVTSRGDIAAAVKAIADGGTIDYVGASGPMDFDAIGNNRQKLTRFTVENNKFVENEVFDCVAAPNCPKL